MVNENAKKLFMAKKTKKNESGAKLLVLKIHLMFGCFKSKA